MPTESQTEFRGGMQPFREDHLISENAYRLAYNLRTRKDGLNPIKAPLELTGAPPGLKQGIYGFNEFIVLFNSGRAYYKLSGSSTWFLIDDFLMNPYVKRIYTQPVPASAFNYGRKLTTDDINGTSAGTNITSQGIVINGTPAALLCQDGINQPWVILPDGSARITNNYSQWSLDNREYVPIGTKMAYMNGILFIANGNNLYRSVSGRPLDFVVNVDVNGSKGGNADTTSYSVSTAAITGLFRLKTGELLVGNLDICSPVEFNYDITIFGEPTFYNRKSFQAGLLNHFSLADILEDYLFLDTDGVRSLAGILDTENEGRNSIFTLIVSNLFNEIIQDTDQACVYVFDNYTLFSLNTIYGPSVLVYDNTQKIWVALDFPGTESIKQFATTKQYANPELYAIDSAKVYQYYGSSTYLVPEVFPRSSVSGSLDTLKHNATEVVIKGGESGDEVEVTEYLNDSKGKLIKELITTSDVGIQYPAMYPIQFAKGNYLDPIRFNFQGVGGSGWKVGVGIKWRSKGTILYIGLDVEGKTYLTPETQQAKVYAS